MGFQIYLLKTKLILHIESGWSVCSVWSLLKDEYQHYLGHSDLLFSHILAWCHVFPSISTYKLKYWFFFFFCSLPSLPFLSFQLENLMYYRESNHNKVVLRDFYLSRFENGSITEPCGTPEYLGIYSSSHDLYFSLTLSMRSSNLHICFSYFMSAPEVVARHRYGRPVDCWAVGVIMYIL